MERTAQNRVIFGANAKKEKSRNPHGYWIFRWRRVWDSNPRALADNRISSYDSTTNKFYINVPKESQAVIKTVERIDAETLEKLTGEEIDKL